MTAVIKVSDLHVKLDSAHILRGINMEVSVGEVIAILGPNGSGKSTLIKTIVSTVDYSSGSLQLFGTELHNRRNIPWGKIGYAPQRVTASSGVPSTALETVCSGLNYGRKFRYSKEEIAKAQAALELVGLKQRAGDAVDTFSGGQQQRVLIARAIAKQPELLILDEPFSGVDKSSRETIIKLLHDFKRQGKTVLLVLHELYGLETLIDRAILLEHGQITAAVAPDQLTPAHSHCDPEHDHQHEHELHLPHTRTPAMGDPC